MTSPAQVYAANLLAALAEGGIRDFYLAPGARSQALAIAAGQLAGAGRIRLHVRLDERSMAFTALGTAMASENPVALITTSGTAVANLHPAVLEANHSGVPLILITADRPEELRGVGANQTTNQVGIFGDAVRSCFDVEAPTDETEPSAAHQLAGWAISATRPAGEQPGPVQINLAFREPLSALEPDASKIFADVQVRVCDLSAPRFAVLDASLPTVVVAGANSGTAAVELAEAFGWPLFAEPSSGSRFGANAISSYRAMLEEEGELVSQIKRVVVFGKPTLSRAVIRLLKNEDIEVVVINSKRMGHFDVTRRAAHIVDEITLDDDVDFEWLSAWREIDKAKATFDEGKLNRANLVRKVWHYTSEVDRIVLGASRLIREADSHAPAKPIEVYSNRGLAGIDGTVATATGIAIASKDLDDSGITRALLGDLTLLHDVGSLAIDEADGELDIQLIVGNDHGGTIFKSLEMAKLVDETTFTRLFRTPQNVDLWHLAEAYGWQYQRVEQLSDLDTALSLRGRVIIDVQLAS